MEFAFFGALTSVGALFILEGNFMKETISKLYHFHEDTVQASSNPEALKELYREFFALSEKIGNILGEENKELFVKFQQQEERLCSALCESSFTDGYSLATRLITESFSK